eukprot:15257206-Alexandrium_andersonii.AAC.1
MAEAWDDVFVGVPEQVEKAAEFCRKYRDYCVRGPEQEVPTITGPMLVATFATSSPTAPGLDGWAPAELRWVRGLAADMLALLLQA